MLTGHKAPVSALSTPYQSRASRWADDMLCNLVSADEEGNMIVWEAEDAFKYKQVDLKFQWRAVQQIWFPQTDEEESKRHGRSAA